MRSRLLLLIITSTLSLSALAQNNGIYFDGNEEFLSIEHSDDLNIGDGFTIEAWILAEVWQDAIWQGSIAAKDGQSSDRGFAFRCGDNGSLSLVIQVESVWEEVQSAQTMNANQWHHVAGVFDNGTMTLYIDGQVAGTHTVDGPPTNSTDLPLYIGGSPGFTGRHFHGAMDEIRIWNVARTATEIADNTTATFNSNTENLVVYLPMNEGAGEVANDLSGSTNNAEFNFMDSTNWVEGYTLPDFDISMQKVFGIDVINMIDRPVKLKSTVQNTGVQAITDVELEVLVDGDSYVTEVVSASIAAGEAYTHEFSLPLDLTASENPEIAVRANHPNDGNALNNSKTIKTTSGTANKIVVADKMFHNIGKLSNSVNLTLPNDLHRYEEIILNIDLTCPTGGCGDWDVLADLSANTESGSFELARYITPYGIACGGWSVPITDFKDVLGGEVEFTSTVFVYTQTGWLVDLSIDLIEGDNSFTKVSPLWQRPYHVYGDPDISYDLDAVTVDVQENTSTSHVRMTISGHGQGNTNNAAEFYEVDHTLEADGTVIDTHHLWNDDCADNPCENQNGTWLFPRAGWCPGQEVAPYIINTSSVANAGASVTLDYVLQDYTNLLNTGYNNNGHTEPFYKIYGYYVESSETPYESYANLETSNLMATISGNTLNSIDVTVTNTGFEDIAQYDLKIYADGNWVSTESFTESLAPGMDVQLTVELSAPLSSGINNVFAEVFTANDANAGDNVSKAEVNTGLEELLVTHHFDVFPNPTGDGLVQLRYSDFWLGSTLEVYSTNGQAIKQVKLNGDQSTLELEQGIYWYSIVHPIDGPIYTNKLISFK